MEKSTDLTSVKFAFWNCALSPPRNDGHISSDDLDLASETIADIFDAGACLVSICEISPASHALLSQRLAPSGISSELINERTETGSRFDLAIFFRPEKIKPSLIKIHTGRIGTSSLKIAAHIEAAISTETSKIELLISHWPSKLQAVSNDHRRECSIGLRRYVEDLVEVGKQVILMGDYNDDPFSAAIFENIKATNDRGLVISQPNYWLYNPFWKTLTARVEFDRAHDHHDFGTCYSKSGNRNNWSTFDQIIFSGSFLKEGPWYVNEKETGRFFSDKLLERLKTGTRFDHFPITGCIEMDETK